MADASVAIDCGAQIFIGRVCMCVCACIKYPILNDANIFESISDIERCFRRKLNSFEHNLMSMFFLFRYRLVYNEELHLSLD